MALDPNDLWEDVPLNLVPKSPLKVIGYDTETDDSQNWVDVNPEDVLEEDKSLVPGGYEPSTESIWNKDVITEKPYTTDEAQYLREFDARGYNKTAEQVRNMASYVFADNQDEIEAGIRSVFGEDYTKTRNQLRAQLKNYQIENSGESIIMGIAAGVLTGTGALKALQTFPKVYKAIMGMPGASLADKAKRLMIGGGAVGGLTGVGIAPEAEDIPSWTTGFYAAGGALASPLMAGAIKGVTKTFGAAKDALVTLSRGADDFDEAQNEAVKRIALSLENAGYTSQQIVDELKRMKKVGMDAPQIFEVNKALENEARRSLAVPTVSDDAIYDVMGGRIAKIPQAITQRLANIWGVKRANIDNTYLQEIVERQAQKAKAKYPEARKVLIGKDKFISQIGDGDFNMLESKLIKKHYNTWRDKQQARSWQGNKDIPTYEELIKLDEIPTEYLQGIKRTMDEDVSVKLRKGNYTGDEIARKREFNAVIEDNNPGYKAANKEFADEIKLQEIYDKGRNYLKLDVAELNKLVKTLDADQLEVFKTGILNDVQNKAEKFTGGNFAQKVFGTDRQKNAIQKLVGMDDKKYKEFEALAKYSSGRVRSTTSIAGSSPTQLRQAADANIPTSGNFLAQGIAFINSQISNKTIAPAVAENMKKILINGTEAEQQAVIKMLQDIERKGGVRSKSQSVSNFINNPISQQMIDAPANLLNILSQSFGYGLISPTSAVDALGVAGQFQDKTPIPVGGLI
jgi:hypothetical protein